MTWFVFWASLATIVFVLAGFPALIAARGRWFPRPVAEADITPFLSLIICAYNEEGAIGEKIENVLALDYPRDRLEVIIASDGSSDRTEQITSCYATHGVRLLSLPRRGKAAALNDAVSEAHGEVLVFSDANSMFAADALRWLVRPLADESVGGVAGDQRYVKDSQTTLSGAGERSYWSFDRLLKTYESQGGHVVSATGAIYAIRRELFQPVPEGVTDDFVTSVRVIAQRRRLVFAPRAIAYEPVASSGRVEFGRKVRVMTRGLRGVFIMRQLLNPLRFGFYSFQLCCHKLLRRLLFAPLLALAAATLLLYGEGLFYRLAIVGQLTFYGSAAAGLLLSGARPGVHKLFAFPFYFCLVNTAALAATWKLLRGRHVVVWDTQRADASYGRALPKP